MNMNSAYPAGSAIPPYASEEDIDLLKWVLLLWKRRKWILATVVLFAAAAAIVANVMTPVYRAEAIITPRSESSSARLLSQLGGLGRIVATQVEAGNTPLDRLELMATGRSLAYSILEEEPEYLRLLYPDRWDEEKGEWKDGWTPNLFAAAMSLKGRHLDVTTDRRKNAMIFAIETPDPETSYKLIQSYLAGLNQYIRENVRRNSERTQEYLRGELDANSDPRIRNQITQLIANEIEKAALVSAQSFEVLEPAWLPRAPIKPKKMRIFLIGIVLGLFLGPLGVIAFEKVRDFRDAVRERERSMHGRGAGARA